MRNHNSALLALCTLLSWTGCAVEESSSRPAQVGKDKSSLKPSETVHRNERELLKASASGDLPKVRQLVGVGVNVNYQSGSGDHLTALLWSVYEQEYDVAIFLLQHGADPTIPDLHGERPVDIVSRDNSEKAGQVLELLKAKSVPKRE